MCLDPIFDQVDETDFTKKQPFFWNLSRALKTYWEKYNDLPEINNRELFTVVPLAVITLILGVYPRPFLDLISATLNVLIDSVVSLGGFTSTF